MSPPVALTKRWKKIKKRCSFSSSDRLVRSKSFTEQDVDNGEKDEEAVKEMEVSEMERKTWRKGNGREKENGRRKKIMERKYKKRT